MLDGARSAPSSFILICFFPVDCSWWVLFIFFVLTRIVWKAYSWTIIHPTSPCKYVFVYFLFCHCLIVEGSRYFYIVLLIEYFFLMLYVLACKNCLKVGIILRFIKLKTLCRNFLKPKMEISTSREILLFRLVICAIVLFLEQHKKLHCSTIIIFVSNICSDYLKTLSVWNGKIFLGYFIAGCHFLCNVICRLCSCIPCLILILLSWGTTLHFIYHNYWNVFKRNFTFLLQIFWKIIPILLYHIPPIFLEYMSIYFCASTSLSLIIVYNVKYVLSKKLHAIGEICKKGWHWGFLVKFSFR